MKSTTCALLGLAAFAAARAGIIPGVGGVVDVDTLIGRARAQGASQETLQAAARQAAELNAKAQTRALMIGAGVAGAAYLLR